MEEESGIADSSTCMYLIDTWKKIEKKKIEHKKSIHDSYTLSHHFLCTMLYCIVLYLYNNKSSFPSRE